MAIHWDWGSWTSFCLSRIIQYFGGCPMVEGGGLFSGGWEMEAEALLCGMG